MSKVDYISFSGWRAYRTCPEQYYNRYIIRRVVDDQEQSSYCKGNALHNLLEDTYLVGGGDPNWMVENAPTYWGRELSSIERDPKQRLGWSAAETDKQRKTYTGWAYELAKLLKKHNLTVDRVQPEFKADSWVTMGSHRFKMGGRIDMLVKGKSPDGEPRYLVLDLKSSTNKAIVSGESQSQLTWYALLTDIFLGDQLDAPVSHAGFLLPGFPEGQKLQLFETTPEAKERLKLQIIETLDNIVAKRFAPKDGQGCWFCPYRGVCSIKGGQLEPKAGVVTLGPSSGDITNLL